MDKQRTIMLVLRGDKDFSLEDVQLISRHINGKWKSSLRPRIICLWDKASSHYDIDGFEVMPLTSTQPGTWSRIQLYSPEMEQYRPYLYIDLDTAVINSLEKLIDIIPDERKFITLEDLWQKGRMATGLVWFPAECERLTEAWKRFKDASGSRMDSFLRQVITPDLFWQNITKTIADFKPKSRKLLNELPYGTDIVCFHGKPRIPQATNIKWVKEYVQQKKFYSEMATVIIPYNEDRGWLEEAVSSVPDDVQLILSQGEGTWPMNFNKALGEAKGKYVKYLHEDDMLTPNCIEDSVRAIEEQKADFIHGNVIEYYQRTGNMHKWYAENRFPTKEDLLRRNHIHSASLMYRRDIFDKIGGFDETLKTAEEREFNIRCLYNGFKIGFANSFLAIYRRHHEQKVRRIAKQIRLQERYMVLKKYSA